MVLRLTTIVLVALFITQSKAYEGFPQCSALHAHHCCHNHSLKILGGAQETEKDAQLIAANLTITALQQKVSLVAQLYQVKNSPAAVPVVDLVLYEQVEWACHRI